MLNASFFIFANRDYFKEVLVFFHFEQVLCITLYWTDSLGLSWKIQKYFKNKRFSVSYKEN